MERGTFRLNKYFNVFVLVLACLAEAGHLRAQDVQSQKIVHSNREKLDQFGWAVSISDKYCLVGTSQKARQRGKTIFTEAGEAYFFILQPKNEWKEHAKLLSAQPQKCSFFGNRVLLAMNFAFIYDNNPPEDANPCIKRKGTVMVYRKLDSLSMQYVQTLSSPQADLASLFGQSFSVSDSCLFISAPHSDFRQCGSVFVYTLSSTGLWILHSTIPSPQPADGDLCGFGSELFAFGNQLVISDPPAKKVYCYRKDRKLWARCALIDANKYIIGAERKYSSFATSISGTGNFIAIGDRGDFDTSGFEDRPDTDSIMEWIQEEKEGYRTIVVPNIKRIRDSLGISPEEFKKKAQRVERITARRKRLGGAGKVYVFSLKNRKWIHHQTLTPKDRSMNGYFGSNIVMRDSLLVVSSLGDGHFSGAVYIFRLNKNNRWTESTKLTAINRKPWDKYGFSLAISSKFLAVGARLDDEDASEDNYIENAGAVYIYNISGY